MGRRWISPVDPNADATGEQGPPFGALRFIVRVRDGREQRILQMRALTVEGGDWVDVPLVLDDEGRGG